MAGCTLMINIFQPRHSKRTWCVFVIQSCRALKPWNSPKQCWYLGKFCQRNMSIFLSWFSTRLAQNYEAFLHCWAAEPVTSWLLSQRYGLKIFQEFIGRLMMCNKLNPSISSRLIHYHKWLSFVKINVSTISICIQWPAERGPVIHCLARECIIMRHCYHVLWVFHRI